MSKLLRGIAEEKFEMLLESLGLGWLHEEVKLRNPSKDLPYHGSTHCLGMARTAVELFDLLDAVGMIVANKPVLKTKYQRAILIIAAMYHDWGHSGGRFADDDDNITIALAELERQRKRLTGAFGQNLVDDVADLIASTRWPYHGFPENTLEMILRDADQLYFLTPCGTEAVMEGLRNELGVRLGRKVTLEEMLERQTQYVAELELYTPMARRLWAKHAPRALKACVTHVEKTNAQHKRMETAAAAQLQYVGDDEAKYELIGLGRGAGESRGETRMVYRHKETKALWLRQPQDFHQRIMHPSKVRMPV